MTDDPPAGISRLDWIIETGATYIMGVPTHAIDMLSEQRTARNSPQMGDGEIVLYGRIADSTLGVRGFRSTRHKTAKHLRHDGEFITPIHASR